MAKGIISIYILKILSEHSTVQNPLTQQQILNYLNEEYGESIVRNTLSKLLSELRDGGYIEGKRGVSLKRIFSNEEIKVLSDGLIYMKDITKEQLYQIAKKLDCFTDCGHSNLIQNKHMIDAIVHTQNPNVLDNIGKLDSAIKNRKMVKLRYCKFDIYGTLQDAKIYEVSPYYIVSHKDHFYLLCYYNRGYIEPRRLDRVLSVEELSKKRREINEIPRYKNGDFNLKEYMKTHIYMYAGENKRILLRVRKERISDVIDWFGTEYQIIADDEDYAIIRLYANEDAVVFWALQYGSIAEVLKPERLRGKILDKVEELKGMYEGECF